MSSPENITCRFKCTIIQEWVPVLEPHIEKLAVLLPGSVSRPYTTMGLLTNSYSFHDSPSSCEYLGE